MPIPECEKIWMNGQLVDWADAKVHVLTHALHYGSGVFEGIRCYKTAKGPQIFRLKEHMERLIESAQMYFMESPYTVKELVDATKEVIRANKLDSGYIRPIMFRGYGEMGLNPLNSIVDTSIAAWPWGTYLGEEGLKHGIKTIISGYQKISKNALPPKSKACGQYINSILAKVEAIEHGVDEAILLGPDGTVAEGPGENLFLVKDGQLITPTLDVEILEGITRSSVIQIANDNQIPVQEKIVEKQDLYDADELFFTGTAAEITPIRQVDEKIIGEPGPITKKVQEKFFSIVEGKEEDYIDWLDFVD